MAGPICGNVEMFIGNTFSTGSSQSQFVGVYKFFNDNTGTLGIQRIAYNTGSQGTGMTQFRGMNYFDEPNPAGDNAWACFRFLSASVPFDMLIQWSAASLGSAPGSPGLSNNSAASTVMCFAFAQSADGVGPWNGTTLNNGNDVKGSVVWTSSSISSTIYYPRSNDAIRIGSHGANRQNMIGISFSSNTSQRTHIIADYDNVAFVYDTAADNSYGLLFFGKYTPISGAVVQVPYFCFNETAVVGSAGTQYGPVIGTTAGGGISYPSPAISGSCAMAMDRLSYFNQTAGAQPNRGFATPRWDEFPVYVGLQESPILGILGQHNEMLREVYNISVHDTNADGSRAVFGNTTVANVKYSLPFHTGTVPGSGVTKQGVRFSVP